MIKTNKTLIAALSGGVIVIWAMFGTGYLSLKLVDIAAVVTTLSIIAFIAMKQSANAEKVER